MQSSGYDINELAQEAQSRWLKPIEVLFILQNHENHRLTETPPQNPSSGSLFLFNKRVLRFFRKDGHNWRKKKDGRTIREAHERLKVGNVEALNCYYAHGEQNPTFQRRSYWMLDPEYEHIVLVHYREISEGRHSVGSTTHLSPGSSCTLSQSPSFCAAQNPGSISAVSEFYEPGQSSFSPGSVEVNSELVIRNNGMDHLDKKDGSEYFSSSPDTEVSQALRRLQEQLSLNDDDLAELSQYYRPNEKLKDSGVLDCEGRFNEDELESLLSREKDQHFSRHVGMLDDSNNGPLLQDSGDNKKKHHQQFFPESTVERKEPPFWKEILEVHPGSTWIDSQDNNFNTLNGTEKPLSSERREASATPAEQPENWTSQWADFRGNNAENESNYYTNSENNLSLQLSAAREFLLGPDNFITSPNSMPLLQEVENSGISVYSPGTSTREANPDYYTVWFDEESQHGHPLGSDSKLTPAHKQRFSIGEISPEWGYATEDTKIIITGSFLCEPSECAWACMFGDIEVPVQIIQEGVLRCQAPPNVPGKVTLCITSGNHESCSEVREFEYLNKPRSYDHYNLPQRDAAKSTEELLMLVRFAQILLFDTLLHKENSIESGIDELTKLKIDEDPWGHHIVGALLVGNETQSSTMDWLLQELLKDKLQQWLSSNYDEGDSRGRSLSKKGHRIIHMVAALGFEWALNPILNSGISINFRDANGWTALHWAACFGREKMVAALIAGGASAVAVTDPTPQDPAGRTPGFIAAASGHKGLAGYLSEVALTSHLSSLTLEENEISKGSAAVEAERTVESISKGSLGSTEDQLILKDSLAAVRNAAQAAARIQSAFRAHSFRRRQHKEATTPCCEEYGITQDDIPGLLAASRLAFRNLRDYRFDKAALSIQKKYRGWKGRKDFLALRQKVVRIQAHVRGHQVRKKYKMLWAVGILEKVVLRWRRRGAGLRGFRQESESIDEDEDEDDDFLKVFRKQKVDVALEDAVSQVLSMVGSPAARQQYSRMLESYRQAKAESSTSLSETASISQGNADNMENNHEELYQFL